MRIHKRIPVHAKAEQRRIAKEKKRKEEEMLRMDNPEYRAPIKLYVETQEDRRIAKLKKYNEFFNKY